MSLLNATNRCQNCDWLGNDDQLGRPIENVPNLFERVASGEPMPTGECPVCGALCQPTDDPYECEYTVQIEVMVTAHAPQHAAELALEDLRDPAMEWTDFTVRKLGTDEVTEIRL